MQRWRRLAVVTVLAAALGLLSLVLGPRLSPRWARARAVQALRGGRLEQGIRRFGDYARRFPKHAGGHNPVTVGEPERLRVEPGSVGVRLSGPALPPPATAFPDREAAAQPLPPASVSEGPLWLDSRRVIYVASRPGAPASLAVLDVLSRLIELRPLPQPVGYSLTFEAAAALYGRPDEAAVLALRPALNGTGSPRLLAVSPDGSWLIFRAAASDPPYELWRCRPDGAEAHRLAALQSAVAGVSFAPDGARLAFFDGPRLAVAGLADSEPNVLREYQAAAVLQPAAPAWSPDGGTLAYGVNVAGSLATVVCPVDQPGQARELPRLRALEALQLLAGGRLLQSERELDHARWLVSLRDEQDRAASRLVAEGGRYARLAPDGLAIAWRAEGGVGVLLLPQPLASLSTTSLPADRLPERPAAPPAPASPAPDSAAPRPPSRQT